jgi:hypothetical protein
MGRISVDWYIKVTVLAIFRFLCTVFFMCFEFSGWERFSTMRASLLFMILLIMFFLEIDVIHFMALRAFFNVPATISKVCGDFALRKVF